jgi:hypothetical protein
VALMVAMPIPNAIAAIEDQTNQTNPERLFKGATSPTTLANRSLISTAEFVPKFLLDL